MPAGGIDVEQRGALRAGKDLRDMGKRARDVRAVSYKVRTVFRKAEEHRFATTGGGDWPAAAKSTLERDARTGRDPRLMRVTGALYRALTAPRAAGQVDERSPDEFRFGTTLHYAQFHDAGKGVPRRKLIDLTQREHRQIDDAIEAFIARNDTT